MSGIYIEPKWLQLARGYIGTREIPGSQNNPIIIGWWKKIRSAFTQDSVPWCAAFVGGVLEESGMKSSRAASARSYMQWGVELKVPEVGCVVVFWRGSPNSWNGHVGFVVGKDRNGNLMVLGGNQGDAVCIAPFAIGRVVGYRWPIEFPKPPVKGFFGLPVVASSGQVSVNEA